MYDNGLIPLAVIAFQVGMGDRDLRARCNGAVTRNAAGLDSVPAELCEEIVAEHDAAVARIAKQRAEHRADAERQKARREAERVAMQARRERQRDLVAQGLSAAAVIAYDSGAYEEAVSKSPVGDYISGNTVIRPISERR